MDALDVYSKRNIRDYLARPEQKYDKEYLKERKGIKKYIRKDDLAGKMMVELLMVLGNLVK